MESVFGFFGGLGGFFGFFWGEVSPLRQGSYMEREQRELRIFSFCWRDGYAGPVCLLATELLSTKTE